MKSLYITAGLIAGMVLLAGCAGQELYGAQKITPGGSEFAQNLYHGYIGLSEDEYAEGDYSDSDQFAVRAVTSGTEGAVQPEEIDARWLPSEHVDELTAARQKLVESLNAGAAEKDPAGAAQAQIMFDCWMQEQEENFQLDDIAACRGEFETTLAAIEDALKPKQVAAVAPEPMPQPAPIRGMYKVSFAFDSAEIVGREEATINEIAAAAKKLGAKRVRLEAHADRSGGDAYNMRLSEQRAAAVKAALARLGVADVRVVSLAFGEGKSPVPTADGVREVGNRVVLVTFQK